MSPPDVVIPVRRGEYNPELKWALRSLSNVPHGRVWLAGHRPSWAQNVGHVPTHQNRTKHENSLKNLVKACSRADVSEEFVLWNDDIFLLEPIERVPVLHRGPFAAFVDETYPGGRSAYVRGLRTTIDILASLGVADPLCYELHVPLPMTKEGVLDAYRRSTAAGMPKTSALQIRSLYGNLQGIGGERAEDVKVFKAGDPWEPSPLPFVSTLDKLWGKHPASACVVETYPSPSPYENPRTRIHAAR